MRTINIRCSCNNKWKTVSINVLKPYQNLLRYSIWCAWIKYLIFIYNTLATSYLRSWKVNICFKNLKFWNLLCRLMVDTLVLNQCSWFSSFQQLFWAANLLYKEFIINKFFISFKLLFKSNWKNLNFLRFSLLKYGKIHYYFLSLND